MPRLALLGLVALAAQAAGPPSVEDRLMGAYEVVEHATEHEIAVWGYHVDRDGNQGERVQVLPAKRARPWAAYVHDGLNALREGQLADARSLLLSAVERFRPPATEQAIVWLTLGGLHASEAELDEAVVCFERAAAALAENPGGGSTARAHLPQYALGTVEAQRGRFGRAVAAHERALFFRPAFVPSMHALAALHLVTGDFGAAAHYLRAACSRVEAALGMEGARPDVCAAELRPLDGPFGPSDGEEEAAPRRRSRIPRRRRAGKKAGRRAGAGAAPTGPAAAPPPRHMGTIPRARRSADATEALDSMPRVQSHALSALRAPPVLAPLPTPPPPASRGEAPVQDDLWRNASSFHGAAAAFLRAMPVLRASGDLWALHMSLGRALQEAGALKQGVDHLRRAAELAPAHEAAWLRLYAAIALPLVLDSADAALDLRASLASRVALALSRPLAGEEDGDPTLLRELYASTHLLPYTGLPHRRLAADIAALFRRTPRHDLAAVSPLLRRRAARGGADAAASPAPRPPSPRWPATQAEALGRAWAAASGAVRSGATVRVGVLSYQLIDSPTGHLARRILHAMGEYGAAAAESVAGLTASAGPGFRPFAAAAVEPAEAYAASVAWGGGAAADAPPRAWPGGVLPRRTAGLGDGDAGVVVPGVAAFEPVLVLPRPTGDAVTRWSVAHARGGTVRLWADPSDRDGGRGWRNRNLTVAQRALAAADLDVLLVLDNAVDPFVASLLQARSAPAQVAVLGAGSGHLLTQGLADSVDMLVVADDEAHDDAASLTHEQLVRVGALGTFFSPMAPVSRREMFEASARLSLFASRSYYVIPRLLPALHPGMDAVVRRILEADPSAVVVALYEPLQTLWLARLRTRLAASLGPSGLERVRIIPKMPRRQLWALLTAASVVLDTFPVGMGVLATECAHIGAPVVTLPSAQHARSPAAAVAARLGVEGLLVAADADDMARKAVAVASNRTLRFMLRAALLSRAPTLEWTGDPDLGAPEAGNGSAVGGDAAVFAGIHASDEDLEAAGVRPVGLKTGQDEDEARGTIKDWLNLLGRAGRRPAEERLRVFLGGMSWPPVAA